MIHAYLANLEELDRSPHTIRLRRFFLTRLAHDLDPHTATTAQIRAWIDSHGHWGQSSRYAALASIRACYRWAHAQGLISADPARSVRFHSPADVNRPVIDDITLMRAISAATLEERVMLRLGAECGLRVHELVKVAAEDISGPVLSVVGKGGKPRRVHMSATLREEIAQLAPRGGYLFPGRSGGPRSTSAARDAIKRLTGYAPHALRRRAASVLYRASGHDVRLVQTFLGHATLTTTMVYLGVELDDLERASQMTSLAA